MSLTMVVSSLRKGGWEVEEREKERVFCKYRKCFNFITCPLRFSYSYLYNGVNYLTASNYLATNFLTVTSYFSATNWTHQLIITCQLRYSSHANCYAASAGGSVTSLLL
jgi:hypothetical protein